MSSVRGFYCIYIIIHVKLTRRLATISAMSAYARIFAVSFQVTDCYERLIDYNIYRSKGRMVLRLYVVTHKGK